MSQTRLGSLIESVINIGIGFLVGITSQIFLFPRYGIEIPMSVNLQLALWFTVISIVRSYLVRRGFNYYVVKKGNYL